MKKELATFGAGCFWCVEAAFNQLRGVFRARSGYMGGKVANPTYQQVCTGTTGHAEVVEVEFNPDEISYPDLLNVFFALHDPTTLNRQGADVGTQYRSMIAYHTPQQKEQALAAISEARPHFPSPIVTEVVPASEFYVAEDYHQNYFVQNPEQAYCKLTVRPKVDKFKAKFRALLKE